MKRFLVAYISLAIVAATFVGVFINKDTTHAVGPNLITNPSVELATNNQPSSWSTDKWGTSTTTFTYATTGHSGSRAVQIDMSAYKSGDAKWVPVVMTVTPNTSYTFSDWYKSTAASSIDAVITTTANKTTYKHLGDLAASTVWKQATYTFTTPATAKQITFYHYIQANGQLITDDYTFGLTGVVVPTPPVVQITSPVANATVSGTQTISATATDASAITSVQFKLDGVNLGVADTTAPYSVSLDTKTIANGTHTLTAIATNNSNLSTTSTTVVVNVQNVVVVPTPPVVQITSPVANATVSGTQTISATATDASAITSVQFKLDGVNLGVADTTAPYSVSLDTKTIANGTHTLTAIATNNSNLSTTSTTVVVNVQNVVVVPTPPVATPNLIPNPSVESTANGTTPDSWLFSNWGTNTATSSYLSTGHTGGRSLKTDVTTYTNGAANWYYTKVAVSGSKSYKYENWYQSNIDTEIDAEVLMQDGTTQYFYITTAPASATWAKTGGTFTTPANAKSIAIYQIIAKKGYLITDDYSLTEYTPAQLNRGLVSLTFDDGWRSIYTNGLPLLTKYGFVSTQYLLTSTIDYPDYMTVAMMLAFKNQGSEIAAHTVNHLDLTQQTAATLNYELTQNKTDLQNWLGVSVNNFATPYGAYNSTVINAIKPLFRSHRSTDVGFNTKDSFDIYNIKVQNIVNTTTPAQVKAWVDQAIAEKTWLVLVYHEVDANVADPTYAVTPANLDQELNLIKQSGVTVETVNQALDEILPQL